MSNLKRYIERLIESKKACAIISKKEFNFRSCDYERLSEDEQAELIKLAILEDKNTRDDLITNLQHLMEKGLERYEEQEEAENDKGYRNQNVKQWAISTQLI